MSDSKPQFFWEIYFWLYLVLVWGKIYNLFAPATAQHLYFRVLQAFHPVFSLAYGLTLLQILFHIIHILPLALFVGRIRLGTPRLWRFLWVLRLVFDVIGHPYEVNALTAFLRTDPLLGLYTLAAAAGPFLPSYWACWRYAFRREKL